MTHPAVRRTVGLAASTLTLATLTFGVAACSSDDDDKQPTAATLVSDAQKASTSAKSTHLDISGSVNGTKTTMTVAGATDGSNQQQIETQGAGRYEGLIIGAQAYLKGNVQFWEAIRTPAATAQKLNGTWWKGASSDASSNPAIDVTKLLNDFFTSDEGKRLAAKDTTVEKTTTNGVSTYTLSDPKAAGNAKLSVKRDGDHQVVRIDNYSSAVTNTKASYVFDHWNDVTPFTAPANAPDISSVR